MNKRSLFLRSLLILITLIGFGYAAFYLYLKQEVQLNYASFQLDSEATSVFISDVDRFSGKVDDLQDLELKGLPQPLGKAIMTLSENPEFSFNRELNSSAFFSFSKDQYLVVLEMNKSITTVVEIVNQAFGSDMSYVNETLNVSGESLKFRQYGNFICFSTIDFKPKEGVEKIDYGNADFVVIKTDEITRNILSKNYHFKINEQKLDDLKGKPVEAFSHINVAPADFDQITFYGSSRMPEDQLAFFKEAESESLNWLDNSLMYVRKDSFELLIARQGTDRDLDLILQEQTLNMTEDTLSLAYFNIGKFKILPFKTSFNWESSISELISRPRFYAEFQDFNIMTNSIPAMRWYIGQIQLGNLFESNKNNQQLFDDCLPSEVHKLGISKSDSTFNCFSEIYQRNGKTLVTKVQVNSETKSSGSTEILHTIDVSYLPINIEVFEAANAECILSNNLKTVSLHTVNGDLSWKLNLSSELVENPQIVDFDNDGLSEFVLFQQNQIDVVDWNGKSINGFPCNLSQNSKAGLAVNYDNLFKYRLIVNEGNTVKVYSEEGKLVEGWSFNGMSGEISGKIYHVLTDGKDIITFKDENQQQYVLNRRGESRVDHEIKFKLENETDFVVGGMGSALRKYGYANGFIYTYYVLDGELDSIKVDQTIQPKEIHWEYNGGKPLMIAEESGRLLIVDQFGYVKSEVLKPNSSNTFVGLVGEQDYGFVFADNSQNSIYLLNNYGKMLLPIAVNGSSVSTIKGDLLYTFSGNNIKAYLISK